LRSPQFSIQRRLLCRDDVDNLFFFFLSFSRFSYLYNYLLKKYWQEITPKRNDQNPLIWSKTWCWAPVGSAINSYSGHRYYRPIYILLGVSFGTLNTIKVILESLTTILINTSSVYWPNID
jgi:hypothetical protein